MDDAKLDDDEQAMSGTELTPLHAADYFFDITDHSFRHCGDWETSRSRVNNGERYGTCTGNFRSALQPLPAAHEVAQRADRRRQGHAGFSMRSLRQAYGGPDAGQRRYKRMARAI
jgi:hypothetical protein